MNRPLGLRIVQNGKDAPPLLRGKWTVCHVDGVHIATASTRAAAERIRRNMEDLHVAEGCSGDTGRPCDHLVHPWPQS